MGFFGYSTLVARSKIRVDELEIALQSLDAHTLDR
jgi:hypothetical protein